MGEQRKPNKYQKNINRAESRKVKLYQEIEKLDNYIEEQTGQIHPYMVHKYSRIDLRQDIVQEAMENDYPEEDLVSVQIYCDGTARWDLNVSDTILDEFERLEIYNYEAKRQKGLIRRFVDKVYSIFHQGGNNE